MRTYIWLPILGALASCGSYTVPASVQLADGTVLVGTTTAAMSGGSFEVATPNNSITCSGTYDALDTSATISVPVTCTNGLFGTAVVTRDPSGTSGSGFVRVSDGSIGRVSFGNNSGRILSTGNGNYAAAGASITGVGGSYRSPRVYTGNCPTPDSLDSAGRRCGARSAASRPGGYSGYGAWTNSRPTYGGSTYVRGHYRKGRWVRGHYRRRR